MQITENSMIYIKKTFEEILAGTRCNYFQKPLQKGIPGTDSVYYCNQLHQIFGEPDRPIKGVPPNFQES